MSFESRLSLASFTPILGWRTGICRSVWNVQALRRLMSSWRLTRSGRGSPYRLAKAPQAVLKGARCCQRKWYVDHCIDRVQLDCCTSGCIDAPSHTQGKVSTTAAAPSSYCHPNRTHTRQAGPRTHVRLVSNGAAASPEIVEPMSRHVGRRVRANLKPL